MDIKQAIYELRTRFNNRFRGADSNVEQTALSGTSATITVPKDCWLTVNGTADNGISLAPFIQLYTGGQVINASAGVAYQGTAISCTAYIKKGTVVTVTAYRCKLTNYNIFGGGGITLAIPMLSASERGCWRHEYQTGTPHTSSRMEIPETEVAYVRGDIQCRCWWQSSVIRNIRRLCTKWLQFCRRITSIHVERNRHNHFQQLARITTLRRKSVCENIQKCKQRQTAILRDSCKEIAVRGCVA